ncbi:MAG TPA: pyridoxamine 5'-phosphate oxidase family protein [Firmicutes bacterium]|jgi:nitroimidazol reductase NimA-like FMN-containing flavoprotein (pyridoxamine 5'-phosphate oxidase superfamily)|nr:pyridoxamine 5'-phosphate oxidase family protein [Bacillota bacterium]
MSTTVLGKPLTQTQLKEAILTFAQGRDTGYLGTVGPDGVRVSPVRYFMDNDLNVYIHSKGGTKFTNLAKNPQACLLVATPFQDDFHQVQGVQLFGKAQVAEPGSQLYAIAEELCPWQHPRDVRLIYLHTDRAVYVDRITGDVKDEWIR